MSEPGRQDRDGRGQLEQAIREWQAALSSGVAALVTPPLRPLRIVFDKKGVEASLRPARTGGAEVVRRFAGAAGVDEHTAELKVRPLLRESSGMPYITWDKKADVEGASQPAPSSAQELTRRSLRLNAAATSALIRFYLEGGSDDPLFVETRRAWEARESLRLARLRKRRARAAFERHQAAWVRWGASQRV